MRKRNYDSFNFYVGVNKEKQLSYDIKCNKLDNKIVF